MRGVGGGAGRAPVVSTHMMLGQAKKGKKGTRAREGKGRRGGKRPWH